MIGLIQRVYSCTITVDDNEISSIGCGLLIFLSVHNEDSENDLKLLARKCLGLRIFPDKEDRMNLSVNDVGGEILVVSQFTLLGNVKRGLRPYFGDAALPEKANMYYEKFMDILRENETKVKGGIFGAHMHVNILNDGPVTIIINTKELK